MRSPPDGVMDGERWDRLEDLFDRAIRLPTDARARFLDEACADDPDLLGRVRSLLGRHEGSDGFLARMIERVIEDPAFAERFAGHGLGPRDRVGGYRLIRELSGGGMGVVFLAERDDDYRQQVAVKVVRRLAETALEDFRRERQILADLQHPNIARLLDGGTTDDGTPYLVMEFVEGRPIDRYCEDHDLHVPDRLALFGKVCEAVEYAHAHLVVHRDLKPSNILVTADGQPKLLDFGIARLLDADEGPSRRARAAGRPLTPEYASPEQLRGEPITTASDVYSLGVLLFLLLSGTRPYAVDRPSPAEIERIVCGRVPPAPSAVAPRDRAVRIRGDLDRITLRALEKDPSRRYASAALLGEDLGRHLRNEPVLAGPTSVRYRAGRFVRRHRAGVAAAAVAILALLLGSGLAGVGLVRATRERNRAERDAASSRAVTAFLQDMLSSVRPDEARGREVTVREVLDAAAADLPGRFGDDPEVEAAVLFAVGDSYQALGDYAKAMPFLERAVRMRRESLGTGDPRFVDALDRLGMVYWLTGDFEGSLRCSEELLALRESTHGPRSPEVTQTLGNLANTYADMGQLDRAEALLRRALAIERETLDGPDRGELAYTINNLATVLADAGRFDEAIVLHRESVGLREETQGADSPAAIIARMNLGFALRGAGRFQDAEATLREAIEVGEHVLGAAHPRVASARLNLGAVLGDLGRTDEAVALARRAVADLVRASGDRGWRVGAARAQLGELLARTGRLVEGEAELRAGVAILTESLGPTHVRTLEARSSLETVVRPGAR